MTIKGSPKISGIFSIAVGLIFLVAGILLLIKL